MVRSASLRRLRRHAAPLLGTSALVLLGWVTPTFAGGPPAEGMPAPPVTPYSKVEPAPSADSSLRHGGGVLFVTATLNGSLTASFVLDSGSADVSLSPATFRRLVQDGTITRSDMLGERTYVTANGQKMVGKMFRLRSVRVGDKVAYDVQASVSDGVPDDAMLLGQTFLAKFNSWSVDNTNRKLVLN